MSEAWRTLKQSYKVVSRLYRDIDPLVSARQDWERSVRAFRTLGDEVQVEAWYLAEHFLLAWSDWAGLRERYLRYFGQTEQQLPGTWHRLDNDCRRVVARLLRDQTLDGLVSYSWEVPTLESALSGNDNPCSRSVFHAVVTNHRRTMLQVIAESSIDENISSENRLHLQRPYWPQAFEWARGMDDGLVSAWNKLPERARDDTLQYLRNYQRATLFVSWLMPHQTDNDRFISALVHLVTTEKPMTPSIEQFVNQLDIDSEQKQLVNDMLERLQNAIAEMGYDSFVDDIASAEFVGGLDSPIGANEINVIPGVGDGVCCTTLLTVSKGEKRAIGFPSIMKQVREHLIRCFDRTRVVIVLCDHWRCDMLDDHLDDLRAHYDRGVRFLFLMAGTPGATVAPVTVDLARGNKHD